jgi:hypothetical protein
MMPVTEAEAMLHSCRLPVPPVDEDAMGTAVVEPLIGQSSHPFLT